MLRPSTSRSRFVSYMYKLIASKESGDIACKIIGMTESLPSVSNSKSSKPKTVAERVVWMTRTSDVFGSHLNTDLEGYLTLIRRKIQEKCSSTQELIYHIRRTKIGDGAHVTPNEFRFTLIKFGVILPQPLVDRIFAVFDSDRSGTMDFDEFAMWIMNSEFRPALKDGANNSALPPEEVLRRKIKEHIDRNPNSFAMMKNQVSFSEFLSDLQRLHLEGVTDRDFRALYLMFDKSAGGTIDAQRIKHWIKTGVITNVTPESADSVTADNIPRLQECITKVCGRNTKLMQHCFVHIPEGEGIKIPFEEFRRCLLSSGMGKNMIDVKQLFFAIGGASGVADIDFLRRNLVPLATDESKNPYVKKVPAAHISTSRADRLLRDAIRKSYKEVKAEIEKSDHTGSGYIDADTLHKILVKKCISLTFQDFRFIVQQLKTEDGGSKINYHNFLSVYDPKKSKHVLDGTLNFRNHDASSSLTRMDNGSFTMTNTSSSTHQKLISNNNNSGQAPSLLSENPSENILPRPMTSSGAYEPPRELKSMWQAVLRECHRTDPDRSGLVNRLSFISALGNANIRNTLSPEAMNKLADEYTMPNGLIDYMSCFRAYLNGMVVKSLGHSQSFSGSSTLPPTLPLDDSSIHHGTLNKSKSSGALHPWDFDYKREKHPPHPYWHLAGDNPRTIDATGQSHSNFLPSSSLSSSFGSSLHASLHGGGAVPSATAKSASSLSTQEREALLSQYPPIVLEACSKCYHAFIPIWRDLRNDFKRGQINSNRGCILATNFVAILEHYGIRLLKSEMTSLLRAFRGLGMQTDVVRFDEFLRVCLLIKSHGSKNHHNNGTAHPSNTVSAE